MITKRNRSLWLLAGFVATSLGGTLLHFLYEWTNRNILIAPFSSVNESTWEHMKLLFYPMFMFAVIQGRKFKDCKNFWCAKLAGIATGLVLIPVLFYTYNGAFGKSPNWINIAIFFISVVLAFILETRILKTDSFQCKAPRLAFAIICLIGLVFVVFTFATPQIQIFEDPLTGTYGVSN